MIAAIVTYKPGNGKSAAEIGESLRAAAPRFEGVPGLLRKYFCFDDAAYEGTSVYIWESRERAEAFLGDPAFLERFKKTFGAEPSVRYVEVKTAVDNTGK